MAELHRVEINEKAPNEIEPEEKPVEQQAETELPQEENERPPWLPEKFSSAEEMAKSYSELEKKLGQPKEEATEEPEQSETEAEDQEEQAEENVSETAKALFEAQKEFYKNDFELTEETFDTLEKAGVPRAIVEDYINKSRDAVANEEAQIKGIANGQYEEMAEWANENLPQEEIDAFDEAVTGGTVQQAKLAVQGLYARYQNATGSTPKLTQGSVTGTATMPFKSMQELARAQSDPRYKSNDKAYHEEIDRRLAVSNI
jgi:hypothetical protein